MITKLQEYLSAQIFPLGCGSTDIEFYWFQHAVNGQMEQAALAHNLYCIPNLVEIYNQEEKQGELKARANLGLN